jgi:hypothetical protein
MSRPVSGNLVRRIGSGWRLMVRFDRSPSERMITKRIVSEVLT